MDLCHCLCRGGCRRLACSCVSRRFPAQELLQLPCHDALPPPQPLCARRMLLWFLPQQKLPRGIKPQHAPPAALLRHFPTCVCKEPCQAAPTPACRIQGLPLQQSLQARNTRAHARARAHTHTVSDPKQCLPLLCRGPGAVQQAQHTHRMVCAVWCLTLTVCVVRSSLGSAPRYRGALGVCGRTSGRQLEVVRVCVRTSGRQLEAVRVCVRTSGTQLEAVRVCVRTSGRQHEVVRVCVHTIGAQLGALWIQGMLRSK